MKIERKIIVSILLFLFIISFCAIASAAVRGSAGGTNTTNPNNSTALNNTKEAIIKNLDKKIASLEAFKQNVSSAPIDESDKVLINNDIDKIIVSLENYELKIQNATSIQQINQIRVDALKYIANHTNDIKKAVNDLRRALNDEVVANLDKTIKIIDSLINNLTVCCPGQVREINLLKAQVNMVITDISTLNTMIIFNQSQAEIQAMAQRIATEIAAILPTLEVIYEECELDDIDDVEELAEKCNIDLEALASQYNVTIPPSSTTYVQH
ncbi:hypothetical protein J4218_01585 [Candidatus Pacearchaeota archaeon]|nr:hypothetical protein [Candidatus Pacearchaeota archaeon]